MCGGAIKGIKVGQRAFVLVWHPFDKWWWGVKVATGVLSVQWAEEGSKEIVWDSRNVSWLRPLQKAIIKTTLETKHSWTSRNDNFMTSKSDWAFRYHHYELYFYKSSTQFLIILLCTMIEKKNRLIVGGFFMFMMMRMKLEVQKNNVHFCEGNRRDSSRIICGLFRKKKS